MTELTSEVQASVDQIKSASTDQQKAAAAALNENLFPKDNHDRTIIWVLLLGGLFLIALAALIGAIVLDAKGKDQTAVIAVVSAVVAGVLGLFANSPASST
jgi:hypothetical protein